MANLTHVSRYELLRRNAGKVSVARPALLSLACLLGLAVAAAARSGIVFMTMLVGLVWSLGQLSRVLREQSILNAGAEGEDLVLRALARLSDDYMVFNSLYIPRSSEGVAVLDGRRVEADYVVVGPNGVFVVEVKNNNGEVHVSPETRASQWQVIKTGRKGSRYGTHMRNPILQLQGQMRALAGLLKARGTPAWVRGCVVFSHPRVALLGAEQCPDPVILAHEVAGRIAGAQRPRERFDVAAVVQVLAELKDGSR